MNPSESDEWLLPVDPRLENLDASLIDIAGDHFTPNVDLVFIHLRDARNLLEGVAGESVLDRGLAKAVIVLSCAALEANLTFLSDLCLMIERTRPGSYSHTQVEYLRGTEQYVDERGDIRTRVIKQQLEERLKTVPSLLGRAMGRQYSFPRTASTNRKLVETIRWRDAVVHPRWDRYAAQVRWYEAAQAIDAVELYLDSITSQLHPYLAFYFPFLYTIPFGKHKDDSVEVGHRTKGRRFSESSLVSMADLSPTKIISSDWLEALGVTKFALESQCEGDSPGSMLTRGALVLLYAMLDAQLAVQALAYLNGGRIKFEPSEALFLAELAAGIEADGEVTTSEGRQHFKQRIVGIPRVLARRVVEKDIKVSLNDENGENLLFYKRLRDDVMHPKVGQKMPRVSKAELKAAEAAVRSYFLQLASLVPELFQFYRLLLKEQDPGGQ